MMGKVVGTYNTPNLPIPDNVYGIKKREALEKIANFGKAGYHPVTMKKRESRRLPLSD